MQSYHTLFSTLFLFFSLFQGINADVELTYPASGGTLAGGAVTLTWEDSGANPALVSIAAVDIVLCTGPDTAIVALTTLAGSVAMGKLSSLAVTIPVTIGASGQYFLKFVETTAAGIVVINYSDRFTLTGMTGTTVVSTGLAVTAPPGSTPAAALTETAAATAVAVTAAAGTSAGSDTSINYAPYFTQTAVSRSCAPQPKPGSKITANANTVKPLWPTSLFTVFTTFGPTPFPVTTITPNPTWTVTTLPNDAAPATFTGSS